MGRKTVDVCLREIGPDEAERLLNDARYEWQRTVKERIVGRYANDMAKGRFGETTIKVCMLPEGSATNCGPFLADGQHRLWGVLKSGATIRCVVQTILCDTMEDVQEEYRNTDIGTMRTPADLFRAAGIDIALPVSAINGYHAALGLIISAFMSPDNFRKELSNRNLRNELFHIYADSFHNYREVTGHVGAEMRGHTMRSGVMAVGIMTMHYCRESASEFWQSVASNNGLMRGDPRHTLANFIIGTPSNMHPSRHYARYVIAAWNAAQEQRQLTRLMPSDVTQPPYIAGTPYDGHNIYAPYAERDNSYLNNLAAAKEAGAV